ncbi:MAG TPA: hypothetical protein VK140_11585 [Ktedonobacteraceae bacterium]|nr:hypothetical protein [Ktedonobacteraceae bacterium]
MDLEMVLNELSLRSPANDTLTARQWMVDLINTINVAAGHGVKKIVHVDRDIDYALLAPNYRLVQWRNDAKVDVDTRRFFRTLTTKLPLIPDLPEFWYQTDQANGLGFAFQQEHLAISLRSASDWDTSHLGLEIRDLDESGELIIEYVEVFHASHSNHVLEHADWIKNRTYINTRNGSDIWNYKQELFPNLRFCESVGEQVKKLLHGNLMLQPIMKRLNELENYSQNWYDGPFDPEKFASKVSPESEVTLNKFGQQHTFLCPDGKQRKFSWHVRLTPGAWRVYFHPEKDVRQLIIGYIGDKLPNEKYPT